VVRLHWYVNGRVKRGRKRCGGCDVRKGEVRKENVVRDKASSTQGCPKVILENRKLIEVVREEL
jgi:hypothetical protein